jgi:hypothetical protein
MTTAPARLAALLVTSWAVLAGAPAAAEPLRLSADAARSLQALAQGAEGLERARSALEAIVAKQPAPESSAEWEGAVGALKDVAEQLKRSDGPALPDPGAYLAPTDPLRSCGTRPAALARVERLLRSAQLDLQRTAETRALLRERLAQVQGAEEARKALLQGAPLVADEPSAVRLFTWKWSDLDRPLSAALGTTTAALKRWLERVDRVHVDLKARASALSGLELDYGRARDCALSGQWTGIRSREGTVAGLTLRLVASGTGWSGTIEVDGATLPVRNVTLRGSAVTMGVGDGQASLRGALSGDEQTIKGSYSSIDGLAAFTLRRQ